MNILKIINNVIQKNKKIKNPDNQGTTRMFSDTDYINQRLARIHGEDVLKLQLLYEKWTVKDTWLIKNEALILLAGLDPEKTDYFERTDIQSINDLWLHAQACVQQGLLNVLNHENEPDQWRVQPIEIYRWAKISRISIPDNLSKLMDFISATVKYQGNKSESHASDNNSGIHAAEKFDRDREKVLGMAVAILAAYPDQCRNSNGSVKVDKLIRIIKEKEIYWLGDEKIQLTPAAMRDLLDKWLKTVSLTTD